MSPVDPSTTALVGLALDAAQLRQLAHSSNIALANTPGHRPLAVRFEEQLEALRDSLADGSFHTASTAATRPELVAVEAGPVEVDQEVAAMSRNALHYQALVKLLNKQYALVSAAIDGGKR